MFINAVLSIPRVKMIKDSKLPEAIASLLPRAEAYLKSRPDVYFAYLFGSLTKGKPLPLSDVDIAVYLSDSSDVFKKKLDILGELVALLETDEIDLVILNEAPLVLRMKVLENKKLIVDNFPFLRHRYESLTMREYDQDFLDAGPALQDTRITW
jgi:predicted nucleotidyltransferase